MKKFLKDYFTFNQVELRGIQALVAIFILLACIYLILPYIVRDKNTYDFTTYEKQVKEFLATATIDSTSDKKEKYHNTYTQINGNIKNKRPAGISEKFNPNGLPLQAWINMGLSEKQAMVIKRFEEKGGKFKQKQDLKKLYVISEDFYRKIEPYLDLGPGTEKKQDMYDQAYDGEQKRETAPATNINTATKEQWMELEGIGEKLADRIIKYKESLGGFYKVEQLKEVYGLPEETYLHIQTLCYTEPSFQPKKININLADFKEINAHPYIDYTLTGQIIEHRKKSGPFKNAEDFKRSGLVDADLYAKLVQYLSF